MALLVPLLLLLLLPPPALSGSASSPHPHSGLIPPFAPGPPAVSLPPAAERLLSAGKPYATQSQGSAGGRGLVVQDVAAPPEIIWEHVADFDSYEKMVPRTTLSRNYRTEGKAGGVQMMWT